MNLEVVSNLARWSPCLGYCQEVDDYQYVVLGTKVFPFDKFMITFHMDYHLDASRLWVQVS